MARGGVTVRVPESIDRLSQRLEQRLPLFMLRMAEGMAAEVAREEGGSIGKSFVGELVDQNTSVVKSNHPGARVQDVGGYITPKPGRQGRNGRRAMLRFQDGSFRPVARVKGRHYTQAALKKRRHVRDLAFELTYGDLLR